MTSLQIRSAQTLAPAFQEADSIFSKYLKTVVCSQPAGLGGESLLWQGPKTQPHFFTPRLLHDRKLRGLGTLSAFSSVDFSMIISVICIYTAGICFQVPGNYQADHITPGKGTPFGSECKEQLPSG